MINKTDLKIIEKLVIYDIAQDLPPTLHARYQYELTENEIETLCRVSSILSLSIKANEQALAYEIITKLFRNFSSQYTNLYSIAHVILSRLGNFPNRELLDKYGFSESNLQQSPIVKLEVIARESENKVFIKNNSPLLTDFQKIFFDVLTKEHFYSISAPTSAGKSFVFTLSITQRLLKNPSEKIVLIVPTRALIRELSDKIIKSLKEYQLVNNVNVRTVPIIEDDIDSKGVVYVLTQERLNTLLNEENIHLDTVFLDEAQEIQNNRGVVLQNTLELLLKRFSNINIFFASPLIENPNYFNELLELNHHQKYFVEEVSPVGQNIIFLSSIKGKGKTSQAKVSLLSNEKNIDLGYLELDFTFRDSGQIIDLALSITKDDELTLIYCNKPTDTEKKAIELAEKISDELHDPEIIALIDFIKEDVHKDYSLINCLKKGVAYHYSHIPATLRSEIERLASDGKLKYVFCTSTLLQGVNLPTKNIILSNPSKGRGKSMKRGDFLNLIGRAGRLKHEFQGNIWCIEPSKWNEKSYEGEKLQKIESFYIKNLTENTKKLFELSTDENTNDTDMLSVFGKFYSDLIIDNKPIEKYQYLENFDTLNNTYKVCKEYKLELSNEIIKKHFSIHPKRLNALYNFFKQEKDLLQ
jgi:replicative superfamily II helicase